MITKRIVWVLCMTSCLAAMEQEDNHQFLYDYLAYTHSLHAQEHHNVVHARIKGYIVLGDHEVPIYTLDDLANDTPDIADDHPDMSQKNNNSK